MCASVEGMQMLGSMHRPPVTKTEMPACAASSMVADTVVAPVCTLATTCGRSRLAVLRTCPDLQAGRKKRSACTVGVQACLNE